MPLDSEILLGQGLSSIRFGMSPEEIRTILDPPDEIDIVDSDDKGNPTYESWNYSALNLELSFSKEDSFILVGIKASDPKYTIKGLSVIGKGRSHALELLKKLKLGSFDAETILSINDVTIEHILFDEIQLNLWVINDVIDAVEWGNLWLDNNTPIRPA